MKLNSTFRSTGSNFTKVPKACKVVMGLGNSGFAIHSMEQLRSMGWDVNSAVEAEAARRLAIQSRANLLILPIRSAETSDLLVIAKVAMALPPRIRVIVVAPSHDLQVESFITHLGARYTAEADGVGRLLTLVNEN